MNPIEMLAREYAPDITECLQGSVGRIEHPRRGEYEEGHPDADSCVLTPSQRAWEQITFDAYTDNIIEE
jgi:hypothetical protein